MSNHGSNIPKARKHLDEAMKALKLALKHQRAAQRLMTRRSPVAKAPSSKKPITAAQRAKVIHLWRNTTMTQHQIANACGIANAGRISEIVEGVQRGK